MPRNGSLLHANIYEIRNNGEDDVNISIDRVGEDLYAISRSDQDKIQLADEQFVKNFLTSSGPYPKAYEEMETNNGEKAFVTFCKISPGNNWLHSGFVRFSRR